MWNKVFDILAMVEFGGDGIKLTNRNGKDAK